jgi:hypothetical protein
MGISGLLKALRTKEPKESKSSSNSSASSESINKTNSIVTKQIVTKQISTATHLGDIRHIVANKTAVIDGYSWLHKAIFTGLHQLEPWRGCRALGGYFHRTSPA